VLGAMASSREFNNDTPVSIKGEEFGEGSATDIFPLYRSGYCG
jgi:hypothetical protein